MSDEELMQLSLPELLQVKIDVSSNENKTIRDQPSIITVVTAEEIAKSGARDLIDVLRLVPGFEFGSDVMGVVGPAFRGVWAYEGKLLVLVDGIEHNELLFGTVQLGMHYPVRQIERIEIIRGPGSAMYGGWAEVAVVKITTKSAALKGAAAAAGLGVTTTSPPFVYSSNDVMVGDTLESLDVSYSLAAHLGAGPLNGGIYTDFYGNTLRMARYSNALPWSINGSLRWKQLTARVLVDYYDYDERSNWGVVIPYTYRERFDTVAASLEYHGKVSKHFTVVPRLQYKRQRPWGKSYAQDYTDEYDVFHPKGEYPYLITAYRYTPELAFYFNILENEGTINNFNIMVGTQYYFERAYMDHFYDPAIEATYFGGYRSVSYTNEAVFTQAELDTEIVNLTAGARYDHQSEVGGAAVPRVALTKVFDIFHVKALFSQAFRTPNFEVINAPPEGMPSLKPEKTTAGEVEFGVTPNRHWFVGANGFISKIYHPIIYDVVTNSAGDSTQGYYNVGNMSVAGTEAEARVRDDWGYAWLSYSLYRILDTSIRIYQVPGHANMSLGMPAHKLALNTSFNLVEGLTLNPSGTLVSKRYALVRDTSVPLGTYANVVRKLKPELLLNAYLRYEIEGFSVGAGVYDILKAEHRFVQPYDGGGAPLPGRGREVLMNVGYDYKF